MSLKYDPTLLPGGTKDKGDMDKVAVAILNLQGEKAGSVEVDHSKVVGKTILHFVVLENSELNGG